MAATDAAFCSAAPGHLGRVDDAGDDQVLEVAGGHVEPDPVLGRLDLLDDDRALVAGVGRRCGGSARPAPPTRCGRPAASSPSLALTTSSTAGRHRSRAMPPPGTTPSSRAALVADTASSMRCFFSLSSTSVAAPTLMTATPPASLASRSCSFSRSQSESVSSICRLSWARRPLTSSSEPAPPTMVVSSLVTMTFSARPSRSRVTDSSLRPDLVGDDLAAGQDGRCPRASPCAGRRTPGALTATDVKRPRIRLTTRVARASPSMSSATISSGRPVSDDLLEQRQQVGDLADLALVQQDVGVVEHRLLDARDR